MKKSILALSIGALVLAGGSAALYGKKSTAAQKPAGPVASLSVSLVAPEPASFARTIAATGTVEARDELIIGSDASGVRLLEVLVDVGNVVHKGQLLARADDSLLQAQLAQQLAQLRQAQAENAQALANKERAERLQDFFSVETVQTRRTAAATAAAKVELATAQRHELEVKIRQTRVVAPAAGVVSRKSATVGAVVQPGSELFRVIRDGELEWRAELPGHSLAQVRAGAGVRIVLDNGDALEAKVRQVAPTMDSSTRNGLVYVSLSQETGLKAGAHARGEILLESAQALSLPDAAVLTRDGYAFVYTVGADGIAHQTRVATGTRQRGRVEINAGLQTHDRVIGLGAGFVKDGDLVRVQQ